MTIQNTSEATKTLKALEEGKVKKLLGLVPTGHSPKLYLDLVKTQIMSVDSKGYARRDEDLLLFLYVCKRAGLDPLTKQIYAVFRWDYKQGREIMTIQTGIDGMRLIAQRTKQYAGQDDIKFTPEDESTKYPLKATCIVYKMIENQRVSFSATARWNEYAQYFKSKDGVMTLGAMWEKMPYNQLGKCAEALALRKAFPNELSGIYSEDEMHQANNPLANLPTPDKFENKEAKTDEKIQVIHGAPDTEQISKTPEEKVVGSADSAELKKTENLDTKESKDVEVKVVEPNLSAMREALKGEKAEQTKLTG